MDLRLEPFVEAHAGTVLGWVESAEEAERWASAGSRALEPALLHEWHADPEVRPYLCFAGGEPVGYGEVWEDREADEAELARILVDPALRRRGIGRRLTALLGERARAAGFSTYGCASSPTTSPPLPPTGRPASCGRRRRKRRASTKANPARTSG